MTIDPEIRDLLERIAELGPIPDSGPYDLNDIEHRLRPSFLKLHKTLAYSRSTEASAAANDHTKTTFQTLIVINGGAAAAAFTYAADKGKGLILPVAAVILFGLGVAIALLAGRYYAKSLHVWIDFWEARAYGRDPATLVARHAAGMRLQRMSDIHAVVSGMLAVVGAGAMALSLLLPIGLTGLLLSLVHRH